MKLYMECDNCKQAFTIDVVDEEYKNYLDADDSVLLKDIMPTTHRMCRESMISHMCPNCLEKLFNYPAPGHEEIFGKFVCSCENCGGNIWAKDVKDGSYTCSNCNSVVRCS